MTGTWPASGPAIDGWALSPDEANAYAEALRVAVAAARQVSEYAVSGGGDSLQAPVAAVPRDRYNCFVHDCSIGPTCTGPLSGLDIGLKDNISLAGVPMSLGSAAMAGYVPDADATVVTMLLAAGARIVGKLRMDAFSFGSEGFGSGLDPHGRCDNPAVPGHLSGGSSSGAAVATAAGLVDAAIGGDQGGSIRVPAAWCGVVGLKPTRGLVPGTGVAGLEPTIDSVGPICRSAGLAALVLQAIRSRPAASASFQPEPPGGDWDGKAGDIGSLRVGLLAEGFGNPGSDQGIDAVVRHAVQRLTQRGATVQRVSVPEHVDCPAIGYMLQLLGASVFFGSRGYSAGGGSAALAQALDVALTERAASLPPRAKLALMLSAELGSETLGLYQHCMTLARRFRFLYDEALRDVDILIMPTTPVPPPRYVPPSSPLEALNRALLRPGLEQVAANTSPFNVSGHPAVTIPVGRSQGLPVGAMLVGRWFEDLRLLQAGACMEAVDTWKARTPAA